jgi:hypothetical protein
LIIKTLLNLGQARRKEKGERKKQKNKGEFCFHGKKGLKAQRRNGIKAIGR